MVDPNGITFMIMGALFISECVHHYYYYYYCFKSSHLIGPSVILLEHGAFPKIESCFAMLPLPPKPKKKN
jgi:hypothetical protein